MYYHKLYKIPEQLKITNLFSFFQRYYPAGFSFSGEYHDFWECVYVLEGSICASGNERVYSLAPGDIIVHKPMEFHKFHVDCPDGALLLIFSFSMEGNMCESLENRVFSLRDNQKQVLMSLLDYLGKKLSENVPSPDGETDYMLQFYNTPTYPQMISVSLIRFFLLLCEDGNSSHTLTTPDALTFRNITTFLQEHVFENLSVDDIAQHCCLSPTGLKRIFSKYAGISIHKYFMLMKINKATLLLQEGKSVTETAQLLGFSEQSYFSKAYKKQTGISPSHCARLNPMQQF